MFKIFLNPHFLKKLIILQSLLILIIFIVIIFSIFINKKNLSTVFELESINQKIYLLNTKQYYQIKEKNGQVTFEIYNFKDQNLEERIIIKK